MQTQLLKITGGSWVLAGLFLSVLAATISYDSLPGYAAVALFGAIPGFFCMRGRRWAFWWLAIMAFLLGGLGATFLGMSSLGLHHETVSRHANRDAVIITLFSVCTLIALAASRIRLPSAQQKV